MNGDVVAKAFDLPMNMWEGIGTEVIEAYSAARMRKDEEIPF